MTEGPQAAPRPEWQAMPRPGCVNVEARLLLARQDLVVAMLRFGPEATIDEHSAAHEIDVICLEGYGFISVEDRVYAFTPGHTLTWPAEKVHRLWTAERAMITLVVERL